MSRTRCIFDGGSYVAWCNLTLAQVASVLYGTKLTPRIEGGQDRRLDYGVAWFRSWFRKSSSLVPWALPLLKCIFATSVGWSSLTENNDRPLTDAVEGLPLSSNIRNQFTLYFLTNYFPNPDLNNERYLQRLIEGVFEDRKSTRIEQTA